MLKIDYSNFAILKEYGRVDLSEKQVYRMIIYLN